MSSEERDYSLYLVAILIPVLENVIVPATLVVEGFHRLARLSEFSLEVACHLHVSDWCAAVRDTANNLACARPWPLERRTDILIPQSLPLSIAAHLPLRLRKVCCISAFQVTSV